MLKFPSSFPFALWVFRFLLSEALNSLSLLLLVTGSFNFEVFSYGFRFGASIMIVFVVILEVILLTLQLNVFFALPLHVDHSCRFLTDRV